MRHRRNYYRSKKSPSAPTTMSQTVPSTSGIAVEKHEAADSKNLTLNINHKNSGIQRSPEDSSGFFKQDGLTRRLGIASPANSLGTESLITPNTTPEPSASPRIMEQDAMPPPTMNPYDRYMPSMIPAPGYMPYYPYQPQQPAVYWMHAPYYPQPAMEMPPQQFEFSVHPPPVMMQQYPYAQPLPPAVPPHQQQPLSNAHVYKVPQTIGYAAVDSLGQPPGGEENTADGLGDPEVPRVPSVSPTVSDEQNTEVDVKSDELGELGELIEEIHISYEVTDAVEASPAKGTDNNNNQNNDGEAISVSWYDKSLDDSETKDSKAPCSKYRSNADTYDRSRGSDQDRSRVSDFGDRSSASYCNDRSRASNYGDRSATSEYRKYPRDHSRASHSSQVDFPVKNRNHRHRMDRPMNRDFDETMPSVRRDSRNRGFRNQYQPRQSSTPDRREFPRSQHKDDRRNNHYNPNEERRPQNDRRWYQNDQNAHRRSQDMRFDDHRQYGQDYSRDDTRRFQSPARYEEGLRRSGSFRSNNRYEYPRDEPSMKPIPRSRYDGSTHRSNPRGRPPLPPNRNNEKREKETKSSDDDFEFFGPSQVGRNEDLDVRRLVKQKNVVEMVVREPSQTRSESRHSRSQSKGRRYK